MISHRQFSIATRCRSGFTLMEAVISALIVGVVFYSALQSTSTVVRSTRAADESHAAQLLAADIMGECLQQPYKEPGTTLLGLDIGEAANIRTSYDDVDDYDGHTENPPEYRDGTNYSQFSGWKREVFVSWVTPDSLVPSATETGVKRVQVNITNPDGKVYSFEALRTEVGLNDPQPASTTTYVTWVNLELQLGSNSDNRVVHGVTPLNDVEQE